MSGLHFALETDNETCRIRDLNSTNGTQLNGHPLTSPIAPCTPATRSRRAKPSSPWTSKGTYRGPVPRPLAGRPATVEAVLPGADRAAAAGMPERRRVEFTVETCSSELSLCRGSVEAIAPADLAVLLSRSLTAYLIVDFRNLEIPPPEELTQPDYLFDWLDPEVAAMVSPIVVSQADLLTWPELVAQGWGKDAVICLFSSREKPALLRISARSCASRASNPTKAGPSWATVGRA